LIRRLLPCALLAAACSSNAVTTATGEFTAPTGLAATSAGDRDVLFIANSGRDSLRALQICNHALLADGGGVDPADTCSPKENLQFVPGPIRVFPANIETANRPVHLAGARVTRSDGPAGGVALAVGADSTVAVVDAYSMVQTQADGGVPTAVINVDLQAQTVDVAAANPLAANLVEQAVPAGSTVTAYVATSVPPRIVWLDVGLDGTTNQPKVTVHAQCDLDASTVPARIAVAPGSDADVYVADLGPAGGVIHVPKTGIAGGACVANRISANGRRVRALSLSPPWFQFPLSQDEKDPDVVHPSGELLAMVLEPLACSGTSPDCGNTPGGVELDSGGILFARTADGAILPVPPFDVLSTAAPEPMQPLVVPGSVGIPMDIAFLRAVPPRATLPLIPPDLSPCTRAPCTPLYIGVPTTTTTRTFQLLAAMTSTDGGTFLIDVINRRYVSTGFFALDTAPAGLDPFVDVPAVFTETRPGQVPTEPTLAADTMQAGVTRSSRWRAIWHSAVPGLDRRAGTIIPAADGTLLFKTPPGNLKLWTQDPAIQLAPGDLVSFAAYVQTDPSPLCGALISRESLSPLRFEVPIVSIADDSMVLGPAAANILFSPEVCSSFGVVAEVRTGGTQPWLVLEDNPGALLGAGTVRGRIPENGSLLIHEPRFDYPFDYTIAAPPLATSDTAMKITVTGVPGGAGSGFQFSVADASSVVSYRDTLLTAGLATTVYGYSSPRVPSIIFSSITGANELLQADPTQINATVLGVVVYR